MTDLPGLLAQRLPRTATREGRAALVVEVAKALLDGRMPTTEARLFVGGALSASLQHGGDLSRRHLRVTARRCSKWKREPGSDDEIHLAATCPNGI